MFCSNCGKGIESDSAFCPYCGKAIRVRVHAEMTPHVFPEENRNVNQNVNQRVRKKGIFSIKIIILLTVLAVLAAGLILAAVLLHPSVPERTITRLETALNKMDMDEAMACFDKDTRSMYENSKGETVGSFSYDQYIDLVSGLGSMFAGSSLTPKFELTVLNTIYSGSSKCTVNVEYKMTYMEETESNTAEIPMLLENGKWVINGSGFNLSGLPF